MWVQTATYWASQQPSEEYVLGPVLLMEKLRPGKVLLSLVQVHDACIGLNPGLVCSLPEFLSHSNSTLTVLLGLAWSPGCRS